MDVLPMNRTVADKPQQQPPVPPKNWGRFWGTLGCIIFGVLCIQLTIAQPLLHRLSGVERRVDHINTSLYGLDGSTSDAHSVNELLKELRFQRHQIADARFALQQWVHLRQELDNEVARVPEARAALEQLAELPAQLRKLEEEQRRHAQLHRSPVADIVAPSERSVLPPPPVEVDDQHVPQVVTLKDRWQMVIRPAREMTADSKTEGLSQPSMILSDTDSPGRMIR